MVSTEAFIYEPGQDVTLIYMPDIPREVAWAYLSDPKNMAQWTVSLRNIHDFSCNHGFIGIERLFPRGLILGEISISEKSYSFDLRMSVVVWATYRHVAYHALPEL